MTELAVNHKTLAVLQPSYVPWLGVYDQIIRSDVFVFYDDVAFDKHGWRNRNRLKTVSGATWLTVPVKHKGLSGQLIKDVKIDTSKPWSKKHLGTLAQHYSKSEYYDWVRTGFELVLNKPWQYLLDLNLALMDWSLSLLDIKTKCVLSSSLDILGGQSERLFNICQHFNATEYLTGNSAQNYLDQHLFTKQGIAVTWQMYEHPVYKQGQGEFMPYLSVLDMLCHCGPEGKRIIDTRTSAEYSCEKVRLSL